MAVKHHKINIDIDEMGRGTVELDGVMLNSVVGFSIDAHAGDLHTVKIELISSIKGSILLPAAQLTMEAVNDGS